MNHWRTPGILLIVIGSLWMAGILSGRLPESLRIFDRQMMNMLPGVILIGIGAAWISLGTSQRIKESE